MSGRTPGWGELTAKDRQLIEMVVQYVLNHEKIPRMDAMGAMLGISRQAVLSRMASAAKRGIMPPRPRYATRWFELTPLGEKLYRESKEKS